MRGPAVFGLLLLAELVASGQGQKRLPRKVPAIAKPECAKGAICFSGEVRVGEEYWKTLNANLDFVLRVPGGIDVVSRRPEKSCELSLWIANPPLMAHHDTEIDAGYEWTAEDEVAASLREFNIVEDCQQFQTLYDLVYDSAKSDPTKYLQSLKDLKGYGRLWITGSRVTHSNDGDKGKGAIEWLKFSVEIKLSN